VNKDTVLVAALCDINISEIVKKQIMSMPLECFKGSVERTIFKHIIDGKDVTALTAEALESIVKTNDSDMYKAFAGSPETNQIQTIEDCLSKYGQEKIINFTDTFSLDILEGGNVSEALHKLSVSIAGLPSLDKPTTIQEAGAITLQKIQDILDGKIIPVLSSGYRTLDNIIDGGFGDGDIVLLTGKTGRGKTTLIQNTVYNMLKNYNTKRILYITTEMASYQLQQKFALMVGHDHKITGLSFKHFREPQADTYEKLAKLNTILDEYSIDFQWCRDPKDIPRHLYRKEYDIVVCDHIHDMYGMSGKNSEEVAHQIMSNFKEWVVSSPSRTCFVLAQPRKAASDSKNKEVVESSDDIKGSQAIQSNASVILSVNPDMDNCISEVTLLKNRHSQANRTISLKFDPVGHRLRE
jgi:replicative DNA helicase